LCGASFCDTAYKTKYVKEVHSLQNIHFIYFGQQSCIVAQSFFNNFNMLSLAMQNDMHDTQKQTTPYKILSKLVLSE